MNSKTDNNVGNVWKCLEDNNNYCWNKEEWINIGTDMDLSIYATKEELELKADKEELNQLQDNIEEVSVPLGGIKGQILEKKSNEDNDVGWVDNLGGVTGDTLPVGSVVEWDSDTIPENWLLLDGQAVSRTDYAELFKLYGTRYGSGDGSTTFNLPNRKTRVPVGKDSSDSDFNTLGKTGGNKTHTHTQGATGAASGNTGSTTLTVSQIPSHKHVLRGRDASGSSSGTGLMAGESAITTSNGLIKDVKSAMDNTGGGSGHTHTLNSHTHTNPTTAASSNLQPYIVVNFIVKAKQSSGVVATVVDNLNSESTTDALSAKQGKVLNEMIKVESGKAVLKGDFKIQYGKLSEVTVPASSSTAYTVNFEEAFKNPPIIVAMPRGNYNIICQVSNGTTTKFDLNVRSVDGNERTGRSFDWIAIGI